MNLVDHRVEQQMPAVGREIDSLYVSGKLFIVEELDAVGFERRPFRD